MVKILISEDDPGKLAEIVDFVERQVCVVR